MSLQKMLAASCFVCLLAGSSLGYAEEATNHSGMHVIKPSELKWTKAPDALPPGAMVAVLEGDPAKPGPFTVRLKTPANYKVQPHFHSTMEHITILSGEMAIGMGDKLDLSATTNVTAGGYIDMEPNAHHFAYNKVPSVIQFHGMGPWNIVYINPNDDPRNQIKK